MSQTDIVEALLVERKGEWVAMPTLGEAAGCWAVHSRVADVRKRGHEVEQKSVRKDGKVHSYYRIPEPEQGVLL